MKIICRQIKVTLKRLGFFFLNEIVSTSMVWFVNSSNKSHSLIKKYKYDVFCISIFKLSIKIQNTHWHLGYWREVWSSLMWHLVGIACLCGRVVVRRHLIGHLAFLELFFVHARFMADTRRIGRLAGKAHLFEMG